MSLTVHEPPPGPEPRFDPNALAVLEARYQLRDEDGRLAETPSGLLWRVARAVAAVEARRGADELAAARELHAPLARLLFLPNSPTLMNAGRPRGQLSACFVLPVEDELESIFETVKHAARIHQTGGGTGFSFSRLRPRRARLSTGGEASGPLAFMRVFDAATAAVYQGGVRRGANMGILRVDHPDVLEFIDAKRRPGELTHFNISVAVTDAFMTALDRGTTYELLDPRGGAPAGAVDAKMVWRRLVDAAWATGDPGLVFIDRINAAHPTPNLGAIESTNPCVPGDTWVLTSEGPRQVDDLVGRPFEAIVHGERHAAPEGFFRTGTRPLHEVVTREGHRFRATAEHRVQRVSSLTRSTRAAEWVGAGELRPGDRLVLQDHRALDGWRGQGTEEEGYLFGVLVGDGCPQERAGIVDGWGDGEGADSPCAAVRRAASTLSHRVDCRGLQVARGGTRRLKAVQLAARHGLVRGRKRPTPGIERTSSAFHRGFLRGLFDADGRVPGDQAKGVSVRLARSDLPTLEAAQRMLLRLGIASTICRERRRAGHASLPGGRGGARADATLAQHELTVARESLARFSELVGFADREKGAKLHGLLGGRTRTLNRERFVATVREVRPAGEAPVFDVRVPGVNAFDGDGFVLHNCGELPLLPYESCNLGSIDVGKHVRGDGRDLDWERLERTIHLAVRFLDDVIDASHYPLDAIGEVTRANRKIGLGVMGWADALIELGIPYDSDEALALADRLMGFFLAEGQAASRALAEARGPFPAWAGSRPALRGEAPRRNATVTTVAPTGTIALLAGCASGIEPLYALAYVRRALDGKTTLDVAHPAVERLCEARGLWSDALRDHVRARGTLEGAPVPIPADLRAVLRTAHEIAPERHVRMQAAFQRHCENSISKCLAEGTLIPTSEGLIPIEAFSDIEEVDSFVKLDGHLTTNGRAITAHYWAGTRPATEIRLDNGARLVGSTASHQVLTPTGWRRLADLRVGDLVVGELVQSHGPGGAPVPWTSSPRTNATKIALPEQMTVDLARWLGMLAADGRTAESSGCVGLTVADPKVERLFVELCRRIFDVKPRVLKDARNDVKSVTITSRSLARFVRSLLGDGAYGKRVPEAILRGDGPEKLAFLSGLTLDGHRLARGLAVYGGMSEQLAYQTSELCRSFGVPLVRVQRRWVEVVGAWAHVVVVSNELQRLIKPIERHKRVRNPRPVRFEVLYDREQLEELPVPGDDEPHCRDFVRVLRGGLPYCKNTVADAIGVGWKRTVHRVSWAEEVGERNLFDITVTPDHEYVVNGIVSHNTVNLPRSSRTADVDRIYRLAWDLGCKGITVYRDGSRLGQVLAARTADPATAAPPPACPECAPSESP